MDKIFPFNCSSDIKNKTLNIINHYCGRSMKENIESEELKMTDIKLIIKIPKRVYNYIRKYEHIANSDVLDIKDAIVNGSPLPKGHGRILDEKDILDTENNDGDWYDLVDMPEYIAGVKAIIEADKEYEVEPQERNDKK